jgi:hypothetical protein
LAHKSEKTTLVYINGRHPKSGSIKTVSEINQQYKISESTNGIICAEFVLKMKSVMMF